MNKMDREIFLHVISEYGFVEDEFEIVEETEQAPTDVVAPFSGKRTLKHKKSDVSRTYELYGTTPTWFVQLEDDFAAGIFKKR